MTSSAPVVTFAFGTPFERLHALCSAVPNPPQPRFDVEACTPRVTSMVRGHTPSQAPSTAGVPWSHDVVASDSPTPLVQSPLDFTTTSAFAAVEVRLLDFWHGGVRTEIFEFDTGASTRQLYDAVELWLGRDMNVVLFTLDDATGGVSHVIVPSGDRILSSIPSARLPLLGHYCPVPAADVPPSCWTAVHVFTLSQPDDWDSKEVEPVIPPVVVPSGIDGTETEAAVRSAVHAAASVVCSSEQSRKFFVQLAASVATRSEALVDSPFRGFLGSPAVLIGYPRLRTGDVVGIMLPTDAAPRGVRIREVCPALPVEGVACRTLLVEDLVSSEIIGPCLLTCLCDVDFPEDD